MKISLVAHCFCATRQLKDINTRPWPPYLLVLFPTTDRGILWYEVRPFRESFLGIESRRYTIWRWQGSFIFQPHPYRPMNLPCPTRNLKMLYIFVDIFCCHILFVQSTSMYIVLWLYCKFLKYILYQRHVVSYKVCWRSFLFDILFSKKR